LGVIPFFGEARLLSMFHDLEKNDVTKLCNAINATPITKNVELDKSELMNVDSLRNQVMD